MVSHSIDDEFALPSWDIPISSTLSSYKQPSAVFAWCCSKGMMEVIVLAAEQCMRFYVTTNVLSTTDIWDSVLFKIVETC